MITPEKVRLTGQCKEDYGLNRCLQVIGLPKSTYGDGYRRILPELRERTGEVVNHERLRWLLREHELGLPRCLPKGKPSPVREILREASGQLNLVEIYLRYRSRVWNRWTWFRPT